jgi:peroxiredoxin Q/BCP
MSKKTVKKSGKKSSAGRKPVARGTKLVARKHVKAKSPKAGVGKAPAKRESGMPSEGSTHPLLGKPVPTFSLPASDGTHVSSTTLTGTAVIYFYPKADTPGCTVEACGFRDAIASYHELGVPVYGVSPDPIAAVRKFAAKHNLSFPLLADADHSVCEKFGVWVKKSMYGKTYMGASRTTFVIRDGKVVHVFEKVKPEGHDAEVLAWLKSNG